MIFWLGTHMPGWLAELHVPLFVSARRLARQRAWRPALGPWALDSGGFTELSMYGRWTVAPAAYVADVRRWQAEIGQLAWAAPQDWMCEPQITAKTGRAVGEHQWLTVANLLELRALAPELPFVPVVQGYTEADYVRCVELYDDVGVDLRREPLVGLGTICRRQGTDEAERIVRRIAGLGIRLHAFGAKITGLARYADALASADSLAWSFDARRAPPLPGCTHRNCANCRIYAARWRERVLQRIADAEAA